MTEPPATPKQTTTMEDMLSGPVALVMICVSIGCTFACIVALTGETPASSRAMTGLVAVCCLIYVIKQTAAAIYWSSRES